MIVPPFSSAARLVLSAAGFIATSTLGWSPGVRMSREAKWIWKAETPCGVPAGGRLSAGERGGGGTDLGREGGEGGQVVARDGRFVGEATADELHPIPRVTREADDDAI